MFFLFPLALPVLPVLALYVLAALLPAAWLLRSIYRKDTIEKEPAALLAVLLAAGAAAALISGVLEGICQGILESFVSPDSPLYTILLAFLVVAAVEEGMKYIFLKRLTWSHPAFDYRFDGIVYAVFVSLGFAALENVQYVFAYGLSVAVPRAVLAVPGHMAFAVPMGAAYGRARLLANRDRPAGPVLLGGYLSAVLLHGIYDACAMSGTLLSTVVFLVFVLAMFGAVSRTVARESATDAPV